MGYQLTCVILKPHVVMNPYALSQIHRLLLANDFQIIRRKVEIITLETAKRFYAEHKDRFFFNRLITFMSSGPSELLALGGSNAIQNWRALLGPTKVFKAIHSHPDSLRGMFGLTDTRNACHGSDSPESANREITFFFEDFNIIEWQQKEQQFFESKNTIFNKEQFIHLLK